MAKRINTLEELNNSDFSSCEAIIINDDSQIFDDVSIGIKVIIEFVKKNPQIEVRIVNNNSEKENRFEKLFEIKDLFLKTDLASSEKIKIMLPGMLAFKKISYDKNPIDTFETFHTLKEINETENFLNQIVNDINSYGFSQFEKVLAAYIITTQFKDYKESRNIQEYSKSRSIYAIMFNDYIVCEGYSRLFNTILNRLNIPASEMIYKITRGAHAVSLVTIVDNSYDICGKYLFDPTADNYQKRHGNEEINIPISFFAQSSWEFEDTHNGIDLNNLLHAPSIKEELPSVNQVEDMYDEVSEEEIDVDVLKSCYVDVFSKIYNTDLSNDGEFNKNLSSLINKRMDTQSFKI